MNFEYIPHMSAYMFTSACGDCSDFIQRYSYAKDGSYVVVFEKGTATITLEHYATDKVTMIFEDRFIKSKVQADMVEGDCDRTGLHLRVTTEYKEVLELSLLR